MTLMACRGLMQGVLHPPYFFPPKATRSICLSPRSFQDLVRGSGQNLVKSSSQAFRSLPQFAHSRTEHTSARACADGIDVDHSHVSQVAKADSEQGTKSFRTVATKEIPYLKQLKTADLCQGVKTLMRSVPQPIAIVTATDTNVDPKGGPAAWRGATISSFNTVTLDPEPIVSFNIKKLSSTFDAIKASNRFWLHFLTTEPSAARLADHFTKGHSKELFKGIRVSHQNFEHKEDGKLVRVPQIRGFHGTRSRGEGQPIAFVLVCGFLKEKTVTIGDHVILFATVIGITRKGLTFEDTVASDGTPCLVYADRGYHGLKHLEVQVKGLTMRLRPPPKE